MDLSRRGFLVGLGGVALAAPFVSRISGILMPIRSTPILWGDGIHDDADALKALFGGGEVTILPTQAVKVLADGTVRIDGGTFRLTKTLEFGSTGKEAFVSNSRFYMGRPMDTLMHAPEGSGQITITNNYFSAA